jgi:hypothetical protein
MRVKILILENASLEFLTGTNESVKAKPIPIAKLAKIKYIVASPYAKKNACNGSGPNGLSILV